MFLLDDTTELNEQKILEIINEFNLTERPKIQKWKNYFLGQQDILNKQVSNQFKPNNKIVTNFCSSITNTYMGYLTGKEITYSSDKDISAIKEILDYNDIAAEDSSFLRNALIAGIAYEICWIDADGKQRFKTLDSSDCIPVYSSSLDEELRAVIRYYKVDNVGTNNDKYYVEVYQKDRTDRYTSNISFSSLKLIESIPNYYNQVPIIVFTLNSDQRSIFDSIIDLQNAYNTLISSSVDDWEAFADCYMLISGMTLGDEEEAQKTIKEMRENRIMLVNENGKVEYINKDIKTDQVENLLARINKKIHTISACPDFTDDAFGTSSGIAMQYKLLGFENAAGAIEKLMKMALQKRIELICSILKLTGDDSWWRDIKITFHRNLPIDVVNIANTVNMLKGVVSNKTLLAQIPFISDIDLELDLLAKQKEEEKMESPFFQNILDYNTAAQKRADELTDDE